MCHNLVVTGAELKHKMECSLRLAQAAARWIAEINAKATTQGASFVQQCVLQKGLKKFGERGHNGAVKEADQLHRRNCFAPVDVATLTPEEKHKAVEALMLLTEKHDKSVKGRLVYRGD
jgi:hypothetical protein